MTKEPLTNRKRVKKRRRMRDEERTPGQLGPQSDLTKLHHQLGNQAVQHILTQPNGHGNLKLDRATLLRLKEEPGSPAQAVANQVAAQAGAVQRQEEQAGGPQAEASSGTVTVEQPQYDYYDVSGSSLAEVGGQLDPDEWGRCTYHFDYSYDTSSGRTTKVDITLRLTIRLPRWSGEGWDKASPAAKKEWQRMLKALEKHEADHADLARKWAPVFKERLLNQKENNVKARHKQALQEVDKETKDFDDKTKHGQSQGVSLDTTIK